MLRSIRSAPFAALGLFVALAAFGARVHWVEETGSAERDGFVAQAEQLLAGELPRDPFRPPLYPLAIAGLARLTGDPFAAARLLSNLSAAALAWITFALGRRLARPQDGALAGGLAMALVAANPNLWINGQHAASDMPFAALAGATLLAALAYLQRPSTAAAVCTGLAYGAAACTRGNAALLLPGLLAAWWLAAKQPPPPRRRLAQLGLAAVVAVVLLLPAWLVRAHHFGSPFHDENWKNLFWKLHGTGDWSRLDAIAGEGGFLRILVDEPGSVFRASASEVVRLARRESILLFGTWVHVLVAAAGTLLCITLRNRSRAIGPARWLFATLALFTLGVATVFFAWLRFLLVLLPATAALTAAGSLALAGTPRARRIVVATLAALALGLAVKTATDRLPYFVEHHPYAEVAALRRLDPTLSPAATLACTSPFLERYLTHPCFEIPDASVDETQNPAAYHERLLETLHDHHAAYLVIGADSLRSRPHTLLTATPPPPGLELLELTPQLTIWRVVPRP